ncbi:amino acid transporter AVT3B-like [Phoenix dactylifera]|uniref:Amino acid transporter AVT3B-like n=1 Tax=Phoenix dactylifera TaxID=42345 RepID=A0A8B8ZXY2_PHODC|nr:amino acid transporter AVT3B-like [Phoenix dactylifera]
MGFESIKNSEASSSTHGLVDPTSPLLPPHPSAARLSSQPKTFANVFIAIVGSGVLGLPYTFMRTGWAAGALLLAAVAALTFYCMLLLVRTRRRLERDQDLSKIVGVSNIACFGDLGLAVAGPAGRAAVDAMIVLSQAGFCVGYLIFISNTLAYLFRLPSNSSPFLAPKALYIWAMLPFQLGLNSIKTLTLLAPLSIFADVVDLGAMAVVLGEDLVTFLAHPPPLRAFAGPSVLLYGVGVAVYAFEGIGMVLPLESEAADKAKFGRTLGLSMFFIAVMYGLFGVLGYFAFGDDTRDIITTNLGTGVVTVLVQLGLCINLFFTFPVMMNPVYEVVERWFCGKRYCAWLRWLLVAAVSLAAMLVPNFADFLSLVGSSVCIVLAFVLPAAFHLKVFGMELGWGSVAADLGILVLGLALAVSGTVSSLQEILSSVEVS